MKRILPALIICLTCTLPYAAHAAEGRQVLKMYSFEKKKAPEQWSARKTFVINANRCLGLFNDRNKRYPSSTTLTIRDIPQDKGIDVSFDMIFVGSWDSEGKLADRFIVTGNDGTELLNMTAFPCTLIDNDDSKPVGNNGLVAVGERERAYWIKRMKLEIPASAIKDGEANLTFKGFLTGRKTEFWAMDNVMISVR